MTQQIQTKSQGVPVSDQLPCRSTVMRSLSQHLGKKCFILTFLSLSSSKTFTREHVCVFLERERETSVSRLPWAPPLRVGPAA